MGGFAGIGPHRNKTTPYGPLYIKFLLRILGEVCFITLQGFRGKATLVFYCSNVTYLYLDEKSVKIKNVKSANYRLLINTYLLNHKHLCNKNIKKQERLCTFVLL